MAEPSRIVIAGAGAVGSVVGGMLAARGHAVLLVGRDPHMAAIARAGLHLRVDVSPDTLRARLDLQPTSSPHRPSVDVLFHSLAALGKQGLAVVLTGMGDDGTEGARAVRAAGGTVLTESESSCIVHGMPRAVKEAGLSDAEAPISDMAALITRQIRVE